MPADAYESDTDERPTPTYANFANNEPIAKVTRVLGGRHARALNRKGRAIARIAYTNGWTLAAISRVFNVGTPSITNCVHLHLQKHYHPHDEPANDAYYAGDEFAGAFPEPPKRGRKRKSAGVRVDESEFAVKTESFSVSTSAARDTTEPQGPPSLPVPSIPTATALQVSVVPNDLDAFFQSIPALSVVALTPDRSALFVARGFTAAYLRIMGAQWPPAEICDVVNRLLSHPVDSHGCLDPFEMTLLKVGLETLRKDGDSPPASKLSTVSTLPELLVSVHGFDLSVHLPYFVAQGFTLAHLQELARIAPTAPAAVYEVLSQALQRGWNEKLVGLSPLEVIALEFCLRAEGAKASM
ncbi:F-box domain-containing protein [Mycena chlorophos]|uniref:F-box domain-containing protein n=1 Tax=Mycena chlorophos TaxID=658473 RepID=A0A8H6SKA0_MYCCL|nr:F-box domain-containing protein [Mycena chlorophos]